MIIRIFRENQIFTVLITFLLSSLIILYTTLTKDFTPPADTLYLQGIFQIYPNLQAISQHQVLSVIFNIVLILVSGFYLSRITTKYQIVNNRASLTMFIFFILVLPYFAEYNGFSFGLLTLLPVLVVVDMLFASLDQKDLAFHFFDSSLLVTVASFLNPYLIFLNLLILIIWFQYRNLRWRELLFVIYGTLLPILVLFVLLYLTDKDFSVFFHPFQNTRDIKIVYDFKPTHFYLIGYLAFLILVSSYQIAMNYAKMKIIIRKFSMIFLWIFLSILLIALFFPLTGRDIIFFFSAPLAFLFSYYFSTCRITLFNQLLFLALIVGSILILVI